MKKLFLWVIGLALVAAVVVIGMRVFTRPSESPAAGEPEASDMQNAQPQAGAQTSTDAAASATATTALEKTFTVTGQNYSFAPSAITVKKGDMVTIVFKNAGGFHDFTIDEFTVATPRVQDGGQATVTFVASRAGSFEYYCSVGNHRAMGMRGTLTVQE